MANPKSKPGKKDDLQDLKHFISRSEAKELITNYKQSRQKILNPDLLEADKLYGVIPESEAFNEKSILSILSQPGCVGIRIHYGVKKKYDKKLKKEIPLIVSVLVGVDKDGKNIWGRTGGKVQKLAKSTAMMAVGDASFDAFINEDGQRCPPYPSSQPQP